ncbi:MAG: hypothetical protein EXR49_02645 [Dehalococcoidia bacterium]|nr:hypothetical protein [Dehalococcoidia bacterium]
MALDLMLRGGLIADGSGGEPYRGDVGIAGGKIVAAGSVSDSARKTLDVAGLVVAPGFWDVHTHYDAQLLWDPLASSSSWHGVTTVITGNCGFTLAPCRPQDQDWTIRMLARVEAMDIGLLRSLLPFPWETFGAYLDTLDRALGVNVVPLVGHSAIRRQVMGAEASQREATTGEISRMRQLLAQSLAEGGMGFSTSTVPTHADGDGLPVPSRFASDEEFVELLRAMPHLGAGFVEIAAAEMRRLDAAGMQGLVRYAQTSGRPVCWNRVVQSPRSPEQWQQDLAGLVQFRQQGLRFFGVGQSQPEDMDFVFADTPAFDRFPTWQDVMFQSAEKKRMLMRDPALRAVLRQEIDAERRGESRVGRPIEWEIITLVKSPTGRFAPFESLPLAEIGRRLGKDPLDAAFDMALEEDLQTHFRIVDTRNQDEEVMARIMNAPHVAIGLSDAGAHVKSMVNTAFATQLLGYWSREKGMTSVGAAVRHLSAIPAEEIGVTDRGYIRPGMAADITVFNPDTVMPGERAFVNDLPNGSARLVQYARGIEYTIVGGQVVLASGKPTGVLTGKTIRSTHYPHGVQGSRPPPSRRTATA